MTWFSIFIASSTTTGSPADTASPTDTRTRTMVPCIPTATWPSPPEAAAGARARRLRAGPPAASPAESGTHMDTLKRLPSTSTSMSRRTRAAPSPSGGSAGAGSAAAGSAGARSGCSDTQLVEWATAAKSGWRRTARSAPMVVATPATAVSSRARTARAMAASRSRPHTTSLPIRLS